MNARARPMAEAHKPALLAWLRDRARFGQGAPSDRDIARRLGLRSTDDALALVQALADDGLVTIEQEGLTRHLVLRDPPAPRGTQSFTREAMQAVSASIPPPAMEPVAVRGRPAPINLLPPRDLFVPVITAPIAAPAPVPPAPLVKPEEPDMSNPVATADRQQIKINCTLNEHRLITKRAEDAGTTRGGWCLDAVRARLLATMPTKAPAVGKPRLSARVIRVAQADEREFWAAISVMIELGATALAADQKRGQ